MNAGHTYSGSNKTKNERQVEFDPIAYGGGGFLSHATRILAATLKLHKLWLPNFVTSCFYLFCHNLRKFYQNRSVRGFATVIFQTRSHEKLAYQAFYGLRHYNLMETGSFLIRKLNHPTSCLMLQFKGKIAI